MIFSNLFVVTFGRYERLTISFERLIKEKIVDHLLNELYSGNQMKNCTKIPKVTTQY